MNRTTDPNESESEDCTLHAKDAVRPSQGGWYAESMEADADVSRDELDAIIFSEHRIR